MLAHCNEKVKLQVCFFIEQDFRSIAVRLTTSLYIWQLLHMHQYAYNYHMLCT